MAIKNINTVKIPLNAGVAMESAVLLSTGDIGAIDYRGRDDKILISIKNTSTSATQTGTFVKGNGLQGVSDMEVSLVPYQVKLVALESGKFKQVSGEHKDKVLFKATNGSFEVSAFLMP